MKLREIREKYLSLKVPSKTAAHLLVFRGMSARAAGELLDLWVGDEWERSLTAKHPAPGPRRRS